MRSTIATWTSLTAVLVMLSGCGGSPQAIDASSGAPRQAPPVTELVARNRPPIPDLPIPVGFKLDEGKSRYYNPGGARFADQTYKGGADKLAVMRFYERQMPISRWVLTMSKFVRGEIELDFEKESERCRITITNGSLFHKTYIRVDLYTSGRVQGAQSE